MPGYLVWWKDNEDATIRPNSYRWRRGGKLILTFEMGSYSHIRQNPKHKVFPPPLKDEVEECVLYFFIVQKLTKEFTEEAAVIHGLVRNHPGTGTLWQLQHLPLLSYQRQVVQQIVCSCLCRTPRGSDGQASHPPYPWALALQSRAGSGGGGWRERSPVGGGGNPSGTGYLHW